MTTQADLPLTAQIAFRAFGIPKPQRRPQAWFNKKTGRASVYNLKNAEDWKGCIALAAQPFVTTTPLAGPLSVSMTFWFPRPKNHYGSGKNAKTLKPSAPRFPSSKGKEDVDNIFKPVADVLTVLRLWDDDGQIVIAHVYKEFASVVNAPGCHVTVTPL
jgi:crossover junction endodeoxyribonuclease RusA